MVEPIGIFDSGIGGTSIWKEIRALMPFENTVYLADSKNAPYGEKTKEEILRLSIKNSELLLERKCKLIVVACNTATTNAIDFLRDKYSVPFIGIEPAIKPAALQSKSKTVGVLATKGTLTSSLFHSTAELHAHGIEIIEQEGKGLVPLIEAGMVNAPETKALLQNLLDPMLSSGIDYLVLGCTHYPYLIPVISEIVPATVCIVDSGEAVAKQTKAVLESNELLNTSKVKGISEFHSNGSIEVLNSFLGDDFPIKVSYLDF